MTGQPDEDSWPPMGTTKPSAQLLYAEAERLRLAGQALRAVPLYKDALLIDGDYGAAYEGLALAWHARSGGRMPGADPDASRYAIATAH